MNASAQSSLSPKRMQKLLWLWTALAVISFLRVFVMRYLPAGQDVDVMGMTLGHDFVNIWTGGKLLLEGKASVLPDVPRYEHETNLLFGRDAKHHNFSYPPSIYVFIIWFGLLPYFWGLLLWTAAGAISFYTSLRNSNYFPRDMRTAALLLSSPVALSNYIDGQNGFFTGALFLAGLLQCETEPVFAGVLIGLLTLKPHLGIIFIPLLLLRRNWRCFISASVTSLVLVAISWAIWGAQPWRDFVTVIMPLQVGLMTHMGGHFMMMPGLYANNLIFVTGGAASKIMWGALQAAAGLWTFCISLRAATREGITPRTTLMLAITALMLTPYHFNYDMTAVTGAAFIYICSRRDMSSKAFILFGLLWALPLAIFELKLAWLPLGSFILPAVFLYISVLDTAEENSPGKQLNEDFVDSSQPTASSRREGCCSRRSRVLRCRRRGWVSSRAC